MTLGVKDQEGDEQIGQASSNVGPARTVLWLSQSREQRRGRFDSW